jgi:hypothetical protein
LWRQPPQSELPIALDARLGLANACLVDPTSIGKGFLSTPFYLLSCPLDHLSLGYQLHRARLHLGSPRELDARMLTVDYYTGPLELLFNIGQL